MVRFDKRRIRELREQAGLSVAEAAERIGVSRQRWAAWETGNGPRPNIDGLEKIINSLSVEPEYFFVGKLAHEQTNTN